MGTKKGRILRGMERNLLFLLKRGTKDLLAISIIHNTIQMSHLRPLFLNLRYFENHGG